MSRAAILDAVEALVRAAAPQAEVQRRRLHPAAVPAGGLINIFLEGQESRALASLSSPDRLAFEHVVRVRVDCHAEGPARSLDAALDAMASAIEAALAGRATLGGLVDTIMLARIDPAMTAESDPPVGVYRLTLAAAWRG